MHAYSSMHDVMTSDRDTRLRFASLLAKFSVQHTYQDKLQHRLVSVLPFSGVSQDSTYAATEVVAGRAQIRLSVLQVAASNSFSMDVPRSSDSRVEFKYAWHV